jgi:hypothetical protein
MRFHKFLPSYVESLSNFLEPIEFHSVKKIRYTYDLLIFAFVFQFHLKLSQIFFEIFDRSTNVCLSTFTNEKLT